MLFQGVILVLSTTLFAGSVLALGAIVSAKPLDDLGYKGWTGEQKSFTSPYASSVYIGWAMASAIALMVTGILPIVSWFATYRFSLSSAVCVGIFTGNLYRFSFFKDFFIFLLGPHGYSKSFIIIFFKYFFFKLSCFCSCACDILWCILHGGCEIQR